MILRKYRSVTFDLWHHAPPRKHTVFCKSKNLDRYVGNLDCEYKFYSLDIRFNYKGYK